MRILVLCLSLALISTCAVAQSDVVRNHWYLSTEVPFSASSDLVGVHLGLNYVYQEKLSFQLSVSQLLAAPHEMPADAVYSGPTLWDRATMTALEAGRILRLSRNGTVRVNLKGGIALMNMEIPTDWTPVQCTNCNNYTYTMKRSTTAAVVLRPTLEWPALSFVGISAGPMVIVMNDRAIFGASVGLRWRLFSSTRKAARDKKWHDRYLAPGG
jgi:hypothetical protein